MLHLFCSLFLLTLKVVLVSTLASCVKSTNTADLVGLVVPLIAKCIAIGCKILRPIVDDLSDRDYFLDNA